jgi:hypothetical protein
MEPADFILSAYTCIRTQKRHSTMPRRLRLILLLVLLATNRQASAQSLRNGNVSRRNKTNKKADEVKETKKQSGVSYTRSPGNYTDNWGEARDLLNIQSRVVGGNIVTDVNKHPFFAEWHGQFCGGSVRPAQRECQLSFGYQTVSHLTILLFACCVSCCRPLVSLCIFLSL